MIEHNGIIEHIDNNLITVRIVQKSACSYCHARGVCMASDMKEKRVEVVDNSGQFVVNESVMLQGRSSVGYWAVLWAFVVPLLILIVAVVYTTKQTSLNEVHATLVSIGALVPYYVILYLFRHKMASTFRFTIKKIN